MDNLFSNFIIFNVRVYLNTYVSRISVKYGKKIDFWSKNYFQVLSLTLIDCEILIKLLNLCEPLFPYL